MFLVRSLGVFAKRTSYFLSVDEVKNGSDDQRERIREVSSGDYVKLITVVDATCQRQGIATTLNEMLEQELKEQKVSKVFTLVGDREGMYNLNTKRGFEHILRVQRLYAHGYDGVYMAKKLQEV